MVPSRIELLIFALQSCYLLLARRLNQLGQGTGDVFRRWQTRTWVENYRPNPRFFLPYINRNAYSNDFPISSRDPLYGFPSERVTGPLLVVGYLAFLRLLMSKKVRNHVQDNSSDFKLAQYWLFRDVSRVYHSLSVFLEFLIWSWCSLIMRHKQDPYREGQENTLYEGNAGDECRSLLNLTRNQSEWSTHTCIPRLSIPHKYR